MQSLKTALSTAQLEGILSSLSAMPSAQIVRYIDVITVHATRKATGDKVKILSAITRGGLWHVMTVPGLITASYHTGE